MLRDSIKSPKHHPAGLYHPRFTNYSQLCRSEFWSMSYSRFSVWLAVGWHHVGLRDLAPPGFDLLIEPDRTRPMTTSYDDLNPWYQNLSSKWPGTGIFGANWPMSSQITSLGIISEPGVVETCGMVLLTFYRVPKHISRSNSKFQTQLPTADPTISSARKTVRAQ
eukprot:sb/3472535/